MAVPTARTNLGPLTTTFSADSTCSIIDGTFTKVGGALNGAVGYMCHRGHSDTEGDGQLFYADDTCFPNSLAAYVNKGDRWLDSIAVYSPGSVCPHGFTEACTMARSANDVPPTTGRGFATASRAVFNILEIGETAVGCCPSGYACAEDDVYKCYTPGSIGQVITGVYRESSCITSTSVFTIQSLTSSSFSSIAWGRRLIMIQGSPNGQSDTTTSTSAGSNTRSTSAPSRSNSQSSSSSESTSGLGNGGHDNNSSTGGLSAGAKIAIGVTIPLVAGLVGLGIFLFFFIRKKRRAKAENDKAILMASELKAYQPPPPPPPSGPQELVGTSGYAYQKPGQEPYYKQELPGQPISEAPGQTIYDRPSELQADHRHLNQSQGNSTQQAPVLTQPPAVTDMPELPATAGSTNSTSAILPSSVPKQPPIPTGYTGNEPWKWNEPY